MPEIRYILKAKYGYVQEWEFEAESLDELESVIIAFADYLSKPKFEDIDIAIEPYIVLEEEEANE